tara:strand:- start:66 stop:587 length:522 start_codon:yes stop_codon:yes gene_type:complete
MPKVGNKRFPYTEKGIQDAEKYAEMTGLSVDTEYREGGSVFNRQGGRVPGMRQDLPKAYVGGALKNIIKGVPKSLKRLLTGKSGLKGEARRVKNTFEQSKRATANRKKLDALVHAQKTLRNQPKVKFEGKTFYLADVPKTTKRFHAKRKAKKSIAKKIMKPDRRGNPTWWDIT